MDLRTVILGAMLVGCGSSGASGGADAGADAAMDANFYDGFVPPWAGVYGGQSQFDISRVTPQQEDTGGAGYGSNAAFLVGLGGYIGPIVGGFSDAGPPTMIDGYLRCVIPITLDSPTHATGAAGTMCGSAQILGYPDSFPGTLTLMSSSINHVGSNISGTLTWSVSGSVPPRGAGGDAGVALGGTMVETISGCIYCNGVCCH